MTELSQEQIQDILPQAWPMVLIDRVTGIQKGKRLTAIKNVTAGEWPFTGHAADSPYFPETLIIEAAAQAALVLYHVSDDKPWRPRRYLWGGVKASFKNPARASEVMELRTEGTKLLERMGFMDVNVRSDVFEYGTVRVFYKVDFDERN